MIIKHPARTYIYYLMSKRSLDANTILATLVDQDFPTPQGKKNIEAWILLLRNVQSRLQFPPGYNPKDLKHAPTVEFLKAHHIYGMWAGDEWVRRASELIWVPQIREALDLMLLGPLNYATISERLAKHFLLPFNVMNPKVVSNYAHYYWDYQSMSTADWSEILADWCVLPAANYKKKLAMRSPRNTTGAAFTLWLSGLSGDSMKEGISFRMMKDMSFQEFIESFLTLKPGMGKANALRSLFEVVLQSQEQIDIRRGGSAEVLEELRRIDTLYDRNRPTQAHELPIARLVAEIDQIQDAEIVEEPETTT